MTKKTSLFFFVLCSLCNIQAQVIERGEVANGISFKMIQIPTQNYEMMETEVTQELWQAVMGNNPSKSDTIPCLACPVETVSWNMIVNDFLPKINALTGKKYRLPTEAEWEFAAKGGENYVFAGGKNINKVGWYLQNSNLKTHPVKLKKANGYKLYDMSGNVWEWCQDITVNERSKGREHHITRGGGVHSPYNFCEVTSRYPSDADYQNFPFIGFRLCRTL